MVGPFPVYATDAYTTLANSAVLSCLLPPESSWALQVTHWLAGSHVVHSHQIPQRKSRLPSVRRDAPIVLPLARLINEIVIRLAGSKYAVINGNLHVRDAQLEDTRMTYRCYAKHRLYGQQQAFSSPTRIRLEAGDGGLSAPRLVPPTRTLVHAPLGQPVYLACHTYANPPPKIR